MYHGDIAEDATIRIGFNTTTAAGVPITLGGTPALSVYKDANTAQTTAGVTLTVDFDGLTGHHLVTIDTSADAFYVTGSNYRVVVTTGTVDGTSVVGSVVGHFSIQNRVVASVTGAVGSVTGAVGSVTGNVGGSVASVVGAVGSVAGNVGGNVVGTVASVVGNVGGNVNGNVVGSVASVTAGVTLADDAITASKFDESTAFPVKAADAGATYLARTGADGDTLETLSDQADDLPTVAEFEARTLAAAAYFDPAVDKVIPIDVDGITFASAVEIMLAVLAGVAVPSGSTVAFKKRDGTTTKITITYGSTAGERTVSAIT